MEAIRALTELSRVQDSKFRIYNYPPALPNKCVGCNSTTPGDDNSRAFIDTRMDLDWYGAVYICTHCFLEMANVFGYVSRDQHEFTVAGMSQLIADLRELKKENEALRTAVSALSDHRCAISDEPDGDSVREAAEEIRGSDADSAPAGNQEGSDSPESDGVEGLPDIRVDADVHAGNSGPKSGEAKPAEPDPLDDLL
jgi:hypothetical protein